MQQIKLLQCSVDAEDDSYLRILLNGKDIKYLTVQPGIYDADDLCFEPALKSILPHLPDGPWISGAISCDDMSGNPRFTPLATLDLPSITHTWHDRSIEYLALSIGKKLRSNVYEALDPQLDRTVVIKFARFDWEIPQLDAETQAYSWLSANETSQGKIAPDFLGHVTENGRVIGFVLEQITGMRHATIDDLEACQKVLSQLHKLGIQHGDVNKHNFLVKNHQAVLIDFDSAVRGADSKSLALEMETLSTELRDVSGRGGVLFDGVLQA